MNTRFSFDDDRIGRLRDTGNSVDPDAVVVERPEGLPTKEWYDKASGICEELNQILRFTREHERE